jgi:Ca-activated chloride channel family protein
MLFVLPAIGQTPAIITPRLPASAALRPEPGATLRSESSLVIIPTWVTTVNGASVTNLNRDDFRLADENAEQQISFFAQDDAPLSIGLLFDASGSMKSKMGKASEAVAEFFKTANAEDEFFLVEFNDRARLTVPFTPDPDAIASRIGRTKPVGRTSLFDAIDLAIKEMKKGRHARKAIVIISDGGDNWSRHTEREIRRALLESDVQLYAMGIFDKEITAKSPVETRKGPALLEDLAAQSGGREYPVDNLNDLPAISARLGNDLRSEYLLGYYADGSHDGKYHHVQVTLALPQNASRLHAYYRRGYYAASN